MATPFLSICVPSRNRQRYFRETISFLFESPRQDVEFVFADNSDDAGIIGTFLREMGPDPRVIYLPPAERPLAMHENWERAVAATRGDWVTVIGDDDLIDPDVVDAIRIGLRLKPDLEAFSWSTPNYLWVTPDSRRRNIRVAMAGTFHDMPKGMVQRRAFRWDDAGTTLTSGFSIYHSAISRRLLQKTWSVFGGRYFEHHTPDYENLLKNAAIGSSFLYCRRPFSIYGTCRESNTAAIWNPALVEDAIRRATEELGRDPDAGDWMEDCPFPNRLGLPAAVVQVQYWMRHRHKVGLPDWEANFVRACSTFCSGFADPDAFATMRTSYQTVLSAWRGGAFLRHFNPVHRPAVEGEIYTGIRDGSLYVRDTIGGATSPAGFYRAINALLERPADLVAEMRSPDQNALVIAQPQGTRRTA